MLTKIIPRIILIFSLLANIGAVLLIKHLYLSANLVRLDPLQLSIYPETPPLKAANKKRVVFFGDSRALSWPSPTTLKNLDFVNRGIGNQTSEQIRLRYDKHIAPLNADIIVLQLCVNDLKVIPLRPTSKESIVERCKNNLQAIIQQARQQGATVIVSTVFPLGAVPLERKLIWSNDVADTINAVNEFIVTQQQEENIILFPAYQLLLGQKDRIKPEYSRDLLHLNSAGYERLNQQLIELLRTMQ